MAELTPDLKCPICPGNAPCRRIPSVRSAYSPSPAPLARCIACGHAFTIHAPSPKGQATFYLKRYDYAVHRAISEEKIWRARKSLSRLRGLIPRETCIVDIGCMHGTMLEVFRSMGYARIIGVEPDAASCAICRSKGFDVLQASFSDWLALDVSPPRREPVCIVLSHVLEHIADLQTLQDLLAKRLHPGDMLLILVPNPYSRTARILGRYWGWWQTPAHLHHFSPSSLAQFAAANERTALHTAVNGADSLFWLSTLAAALQTESRPPTRIFTLLVQIFSGLARYWYYLGDEEQLILSRKASSQCSPGLRQ